MPASHDCSATNALVTTRPTRTIALRERQVVDLPLGFVSVEIDQRTPRRSDHGVRIGRAVVDCEMGQRERVARNPAGAVAQTTAAHVVAAPVPTLTGLSVSPKTASVAGRLVAGRCVKPTNKNRIHKPCTRPIKLRIRYTLNGSATVTFTIKRLAPGRQVNGRCVKPTHKNGNHKRCNRLASARRIDKPGEAGANSFTFSGRLVPATYHLTATLPGGTRQRATFRLTS